MIKDSLLMVQEFEETISDSIDEYLSKTEDVKQGLATLKEMLSLTPDPTARFLLKIVVYTIEVRLFEKAINVVDT